MARVALRQLIGKLGPLEQLVDEPIALAGVAVGGKHFDIGARGKNS